MKFTVLRDNKEKSAYWQFNSSTSCAGTISSSLPTGDYTIQGLELVFTIERKASTGELANNLPTKRFERELQRMELFSHAYIVCEFTMKDLCNFPYNSGIPRKIWPRLRVTSTYMLKKVVELESKYKVKFIFAGDNGKDVAKAIFKRMLEMYKDQIPKAA